MNRPALTEAAISGFKVMRQVRALLAPITLLVGPHGGGKTLLLDGLRTFQVMATQKTLHDISYTRRVMENFRRYPSLHVGLSWTPPAGDPRWLLESSMSPDAGASYQLHKDNRHRASWPVKGKTGITERHCANSGDRAALREIANLVSVLAFADTCLEVSDEPVLDARTGGVVSLPAFLEEYAAFLDVPFNRDFRRLSPGVRNLHGTLAYALSRFILPEPQAGASRTTCSENFCDGLNSAVIRRVPQVLLALAATNRRFLLETHSAELVHAFQEAAATATPGSEEERLACESVVVVVVEECGSSQYRINPHGELVQLSGPDDNTWFRSFLSSSEEGATARFYGSLSKTPESGQADVVHDEGDEPGGD